MAAKKFLKDILNIEYDIILAPMFLVSNTKMVMAALDAGITGCIPALNYRTDKELRAAIAEIKAHSDKPFGINLIANKSNISMDRQLDTCVELGVGYIITSLGNPKKVIEACHAKGIKVFCDVVNLEYAKKVEAQGADALIAVNSRAGGHAGNMTPEELIPLLIKECSIPVISAGGVGNKEQLDYIFSLGASGVSMGSIFIATHEAPVTDEYKQAIIDYGADDIIMTTKLSGSPCTVIQTPYVKEIGTKQNFLEKLLNKNKTLKKYVKMLIFKRGMDSLKKAAFSTSYKTVWCAGPSIEEVDEIRSVGEIVGSLVGDN